MNTFSTFAPRLLLPALLAMLPILASAQPDLTVTGPLTQTIPGGTYNNVTITSTRILSLSGPLVVNGALTIMAGGRLSPDCNSITGSGNFVLAANGILDICSPAGITLSGPSGSIQMTGSRSYSSDANYLFSGTLPGQVTGNGMPTTVRSLQNYNTDGLSITTDLALGTDISVRQLVRANGGVLNTNGHTLRLMSAMGGTALIINASGGTILGNVTAERLITPDLNAGSGYRHYSSPVNGQTVANLATTGFTPVFNTAFNSSATPRAIQPFPTVYDYNPAQAGTKAATTLLTPFDMGWRASASTDAMTAGKGFTVHIAAGARVELTGQPRTGTYTVAGLDRGTDPDGGWQFLGNPYPAPMDWSTVATTGLTNVGAAMYVFETTATYGGNYRSYVNSVGTPVVAMGQGFFVRSTADGGSVSITDASRIQTYDPNDGIFRRGAAGTRPLLRLTLAEATATLTNGDDAVLYAQAGASPAFDAMLDAPKMHNPSGLNLAVQPGTDPYSIKALANFGTTSPVLIPLAVGLPAAGNYHLQVKELLNMPTGLMVYLHDALRNTRTPLTATMAYPFSSATTTANGRFSLELAPAGTALATAAQLLTAQVHLYPNPAQGHFHVMLPVGGKAMSAALTNTLGQVVLHRSLSSNEADFTVATPGLYTLRLAVDGATVSRKVVVG